MKYADEVTVGAHGLVFAVFHGKDGWRWHARAQNGRLIATSGEAFGSKASARRAMHRLLTQLYTAKEQQ